MGHRVFHPVYYVLVMSEGQIIGLVCDQYYRLGINYLVEINLKRKCFFL